MAHWIDRLRKYTPCEDGLAEVLQYDTAKDWWQATKRGDWMLWYLERAGYDDEKTLRLLACRIVRETVWHLLTDERSRNAVIVAERYANGDATDEELKAARSAAWAAAAWAAAASEAVWAAEDAAWAAAYSAEAAASEAAGRAAAASEAVWAASAAAWSQHADIIRDMIPLSVVEELESVEV